MSDSLNATTMSAPTSVRLNIPNDGPDRLLTTTGVEAAQRHVVPGYSYKTGTVVPAGEWSTVAEGTRTRLTNHNGTPNGARIDVVKAPDELVRTLRALGFTRGSHGGRYHIVVSKEDYREALVKKLPLLDYLIERPDELKLLGVAVRPGGLLTTSANVEPDGSETLTGLHVDNWDKKAPGDRHSARRLLSINLGEDARYLIFAPSTVDDFTRVGICAEDGYAGYPAQVFSSLPKLPLYKVQIRPGEMYIAPTENVIHDGTTIGNDCLDVTMNFRGYFGCGLRPADAGSADLRC